MEEIRLKNFDDLLDSVRAVKDEIVGDKKKLKKKEKLERVERRVTFLIAIISFLLSLYTIYDNNKTDERNFSFQRENQAYNFWLSYLRLASQHPDMANGLMEIDGVPIGDLACRNLNGKSFPDTTQMKFVDYAWFVANALGTAEIVSELTTDDRAWAATIDTIISNHLSYVGSNCFEKEHYGRFINDEIKKLNSLRNK